jgi:hypothetical protein
MWVVEHDGTYTYFDTWNVRLKEVEEYMEEHGLGLDHLYVTLHGASRKGVPVTAFEDAIQKVAYYDGKEVMENQFKLDGLEVAGYYYTYVISDDTSQGERRKNYA